MAAGKHPRRVLSFGSFLFLCSLNNKQTIHPCPRFQLACMFLKAGWNTHFRVGCIWIWGEDIELPYSCKAKTRHGMTFYLQVCDRRKETRPIHGQWSRIMENGIWRQNAKGENKSEKQKQRGLRCETNPCWCLSDFELKVRPSWGCSGPLLRLQGCYFYEKKTQREQVRPSESSTQREVWKRWDCPTLVGSAWFSLVECCGGCWSVLVHDYTHTTLFILEMKLQVFISKIYSFSCIYFFVVFCVFADRTWSKVHSCSTLSNQASQGKSAAVGEWMWLPESFLSYFISTWFLSFWFPSCFFFPHSPTFARSFLFFSFFLSSLLSFLISANFQSCILFPPSHCLYHSLLSLHPPAAQLLFVYFQPQPLIGRNSPSFSFHSIHVPIHIHIHIHHYSLFHSHPPTHTHTHTQHSPSQTRILRVPDLPS